MIAGLRAGGGGLCERIEGVALSTDVASFLGEPAREGQAYLGPAPREGLDARLLRAMGRSEAVEVLVAPISIGDRVVNLLYADNGTERLPRTSVAALGALTRLVSDAYQGLILARKQARR